MARNVTIQRKKGQFPKKDRILGQEIHTSRSCQAGLWRAASASASRTRPLSGESSLFMTVWTLSWHGSESISRIFCTWLNKPQAIWTNLFMCSSLSPVYLPVNIFDYLLPVIYVQHYVASFHLPINIFLLTFSICKTSTFSCAFAQYVSKKEDQKELKLYRTVNTPPPPLPPHQQEQFPSYYYT